MNYTPPVTVLMPVHNAADYVSHAVSSILNQDFAHFEFLIMDDGSTDSSVEIIRAFRDDRIRFIQCSRAGLVRTLNLGISLARCPLIARMDADDIALPGRLGRQIEVLSASPEAVAVGGSVHLIDACGRMLGRSQVPPCDHGRILANLLSPATGPGLPHPAVMMRRQAVLRCGGYRAEFPCSEDKDLWLRLSRIGQLRCVPEPVLLLRKHGDNVSLRQEQLQLTSGIAAIVCHKVWMRTGIDLVEHARGGFHRCVAMVETCVAKHRLMEARECRKELVFQLRRRSMLGVVSALAGIASKHQVVHSIRLAHLFRSVIDELVEDTLVAISSSGGK